MFTRQKTLRFVAVFVAGMAGAMCVTGEEGSLLLPNGHPLRSGEKLAEKIYLSSKEKAPAAPVDASQTKETGFEVSLNGKWVFFPFPSLAADKITEIKWEQIYVPGPWADVARDYSADQVRRWNPKDKSMAAWYAVKFFIPENYQNKAVKLHFGAVYLYSQVYLNGKKLAEHTAGNSPFEVDITGEVKFGQENVLNVFVVDQAAGYGPNEVGAKAFFTPMLHGYFMLWRGNFMARMGIWQGVKLRVYPRTFIEDTYITTSVRNKAISIAQTITNSSGEEVALTIQHAVFADENIQKEVKRLSSREIKVSKGSSTSIEATEPWENADYWSPQNPKLYYLQTRLYQGKALIDERITRFGFREFWIQGKNFVLNGKKIRLRGMTFEPVILEYSSWQEKAYARLAFEACKKDLGYNYLRLFGNQCPAVLDAADEAGILVEAVSPLIVSGTGAIYEAGGGRFLKNAEIEFSSWIRSNRNHPCVVIWGLENEWACNWTERGNLSDKAVLMLNRLKEFALRWDQSRLINYEGGLAFPAADFYHYHCGIHNLFFDEAFYRSWSANTNLNRPLVGGELSINGVADAYRDSDISNDGELANILAENCERHITAGRLAGLSGVILHAVDQVIFASPYKRRQVLAGGRVVQGQNIHGHFGTKFKTIDWVNPGWVKDCPKYVLNEPIASTLKKDFSEIWVWIKARSGNYYAGEKIEKSVFVCNDSGEDKELRLVCELSGAGGTAGTEEKTLKLKNCEETTAAVSFDLPTGNVPGDYRLTARVFAGEKQAAGDEIKISAAQREKMFPAVIKKKIVIYDKTGRLAELLTAEGARHEEYKPGMVFDRIDLLLIGKNSVDEEIGDRKEELEQYVRSGGRVVIFQQQNNIQLMPVKLSIQCWRNCRTSAWGVKHFNMPEKGAYGEGRFAYILAKTHPIFRGIEGGRLAYFRDGDERVFAEAFGNPLLLPYPLYQNIRILSGYGKSGQVLEYFLGKGSYLLCQLNLIDNAGIDPVAARIFSNIIRYAGSEASRFPKAKTLVIGEKAGKLLKELGVMAEYQKAMEEMELAGFDLVMIGGEISEDDLAENKDRITEYVRAGGKVFFFPRSKPFSAGTLGPIGVKKANPVTARVRPDDLTQGLRGYNFYRYGDDLFLRTDYLLEIPEKIKAEPLIISSDFHEYDGFEKAEEKPMLARIRDGKGEYILNQVLFGTGKEERSLNILAVLLTNMGVPLSKEKAAVSAAGKVSESVECIKAGKVVIDGELDEWTRDVPLGVDKLRIKDIPYRHSRPIKINSALAVKEEGLKAPADNTDCGAVAYTMWDEENFYIAAKVIDDKICFTKMKGEPLHYADAMEFFLDSQQIVCTLQRNGEEILHIGGYNAISKHEGGTRLYSNGEAGVRLKIRKAGKLGDTADMELLGNEVKGKDGYVIEAAIPWELLTEKKINPGVLFQFASGFDDNDDGREGSARETQLFFPQGWVWRNNDTYANLALTEEW